MSPRFYEVWVGGYQRAAKVSRDEADHLAQRIAEDSWGAAKPVWVEVRPITIGPHGPEVAK